MLVFHVKEREGSAWMGLEVPTGRTTVTRSHKNLLRAGTPGSRGRVRLPCPVTVPLDHLPEHQQPGQEGPPRCLLASGVSHVGTFQLIPPIILPPPLPSPTIICSTGVESDGQGSESPSFPTVGPVGKAGRSASWSGPRTCPSGLRTE